MHGHSSKFVSETPHLLLAFGLKVIVKHINISQNLFSQGNNYYLMLRATV